MRYLVAALVAVLIIPPLIVAGVLWDINQHWREADFDEHDEDDEGF